MNERYLHHVWMNKRIPSIQVRLTDERKIDILNFGYHNRSAAGPDFSMGIIHMEGTDIFGPIELHLKSSDWYRHGHHNDAAYNNVILHVVYEHDQEVIQNGRVLPTLEIAQYVDAIHHRNYRQSTSQSSILCIDHLPNQSDELEKMKLEALIQKLTDRIELFIDNNSDLSSTYYKLLARSCGATINRQAFDEMTDRISLSTVRRMHKNDRFPFLEKESGLINTDTSRETWHLSGFFPAGHPLKRLNQFTDILNAMDPVDEMKLILNVDFKGFQEFLGTKRIKVPLNFMRHTFINAVVPTQFIHRYVHGLEVNKVLDKLKALPGENNRIVKLWKSSGVEIDSAYDSQGLIALYNSLCNEKKCLSCEVGNALVKEPDDTENCVFL